MALGALVFAAVKAGVALLFPLVALSSHGRGDRNVWDDFLLAAYLVVMSAVLSAVGFGIATAPSARWRRLVPVRAVVIGAGLGLVAPIVGLFVSGLIGAAILPLFRSAPWVTVALFHGVPGVALGFAAVLLATVWRTA